MRSVVVAKFVPWPPNSGDKRRTLGVVRALAQRGPVTVCAFTGPDDDAGPLRAQGIDVRTVPLRRRPLDLAEGLLRGRSLTAARFFDRRLAALVRAACAGGAVEGADVGEADADRATEADVLVVEHVQLLALARAAPAGARVVDMHNVESLLAARIAASSSGARARVFAAEAMALRALERRAVAGADVVAVVSEVDRRALEKVTGPRRLRATTHGGTAHGTTTHGETARGGTATDTVVLPNAWGDVAPLPPASGPVASFVALQSWGPNVDASLWFTRAVWPVVLAQVPSARLHLVGRNPTEAVRALAGPSVLVSGTVDDLTPWYERTRVALAPLLAGGGSRLKILEALAAGRPVVATTVGAEGLEDLIGRGVVVADDAPAMARVVAELLTDAERARALGLLGARAVEADHSWSAAVAPLLARLDALAAARAHRGDPATASGARSGDTDHPSG